MVNSLMKVLLLLQASLYYASAFQQVSPAIHPICTSLASSSSSSDEAPAAVVTVEQVIKDNYPEFHALLSKNENIFEAMDKDLGEDGYTIFAPTSAAFEAVTDKQKKQLDDPRNLETAQKMGLCHIVQEAALTLGELNCEDWTVPKTMEGLPALKIGGVMTMGGEVPIGRYKKKTRGSFFRTLVKQEKTVRDKDGKAVTEIVVGPEGAILRSVKVGNAIIHEVDALVSPSLLWRYCDQLRMPGF